MKPEQKKSRPLFEHPLHVGRPNIGDRTAFMQKVEEILDRQWLTNNGQCVQELERRLCERLRVKHCIPVCNGTVGLEVAIRALGLTGEVILPSFTFVATAHAVQWLGLKPVFCDIDPDSMNLDPAQVQRCMSPETSAILGVHVYGNPCDVHALQSIADQHNVALLFDASHAFNCSYKNRMIGNFGRCEVFSFHATKIFNTFEGGAIATNDDELAATIRGMINFGFQDMDRVTQLGINGKMSEICAAMGLVNLNSLDETIEINKRNFEVYQEELAGVIGLKLFQFDEVEQCNWQYVIVEVGQEYPLDRDSLLEALRAEKILARRYFWPGCHRMEPYQTIDAEAGIQLPVTEAMSCRIIALPTGRAVKSADIRTICQLIKV